MTSKTTHPPVAIPTSNGLAGGDVAERLAALEAENAELKERAFHRQQTTALKLERMAKWARERLSEEPKEQFFDIYANGVEDIHEQPTAAQMMNMLRHDRDGLLELLGRVDRYLTGDQTYEYGVMDRHNEKSPADFVRAAIARARGTEPANKESA